MKTKDTELVRFAARRLLEGLGAIGTEIFCSTLICVKPDYREWREKTYGTQSEKEIRSQAASTYEFPGYDCSSYAALSRYLEENKNEILDTGMRCLTECAGTEGAEAYILATLRSAGDYTEWRRQHFDSMTEEEIRADLEEYCRAHPSPKRAANAARA